MWMSMRTCPTQFMEVTAKWNWIIKLICYLGFLPVYFISLITYTDKYLEMYWVIAEFQYTDTTVIVVGSYCLLLWLPHVLFYLSTLVHNLTQNIKPKA